MSKDLLEELENDAAFSAVPVTDDALKSVRSIALQMQTTQQKVSQLEEDLKREKENLRKLSDEDLPSKLQEVGIVNFELDDGSVVQVKENISAHIKEANRAAAYEWLRDNALDDIIKNTVVCSFGREEDDRASDFFAFAKKEGFEPQQNSSIHPSTLKAFAKDRIAQGEEIPMDLFGIWVGQRATIKKSKKGV